MEDNLQTIDLLQVWQTIRKRWLIVVVLPLLAILTSGVLSIYVIKPTYQATATVIVGKNVAAQADKMQDYNSVLANQQLAKTYETIAKSRTVLARVADQVGGDATPESLVKQVTVAAVKSTEVIAIDVQDRDAQRAADIANKITTAFTTRVIEVKKVDSVSVIDAATIPKAPIKPNKRLNLALAFVLGLFAAIGVVFLLEMLDNTIKTAEELENLIGLSVLGSIPQFSATNNPVN